MGRLRICPTPLDGLTVVERSVDEDERGHFSRLFCAEELRGAGGEPFAVAQINHSVTERAGSVRGLHFQWPPHGETKLVSCLRGAVFDVAVDLRRGSPTFLRWHGEVLSRENRRAALIPEGFAHGFQTLEPGCELIYVHSRAYDPSAEGGLDPADTALAIAWPLPFADVSARDRGHPRIGPAFVGL
ncbi:MAG TPA: dTDP-4-dehydrorhamnose 3,5-epimerase family protein [Caldimonas sp.]|nr:dTDP-4-dehydrorhamnose 3,5-epimerase family protein [Caldimonas sp.]